MVSEQTIASTQWDVRKSGELHKWHRNHCLTTHKAPTPWHMKLWPLAHMSRCRISKVVSHTLYNWMNHWLICQTTLVHGKFEHTQEKKKNKTGGGECPTSFSYGHHHARVRNACAELHDMPYAQSAMHKPCHSMWTKCHHILKSCFSRSSNLANELNSP